MFNRKIVIVAGAGASHEYGLPLGSELKAEISKDLHFSFEHVKKIKSGSADLISVILRHDQSRINEYLSAGRTVAKAIPMFSSIDEALHFLSESPDSVFIGKLAIAHRIILAERRSVLRIDREYNRVKLPEQTWLSTLLSMAAAGVRKDELHGVFQNLTIINFNYDRTIEHFLYWSLQEYAAISSETAAKIVSKINMIRPYGSLGPLEWCAMGGVSYGAEHHQLVELTKNIKTFTEQDAVDCRAAITSAIEDASVLVFLGFGFHSQNVDLLKIEKINKKVKTLATVKGIHDENLPSMRARLTANIGVRDEHIKMLSMGASDMLRELRPMIQTDLR